MDTIERLHTDNSHVPGPTEGGPEWLNSVEVANHIVEEFGAEVIRRHGRAVGAGKADGFMAWLHGQCEAWNRVYMGKPDPEHPYATGPWNAPDQLGSSIRVNMRLAPGPDDEGVRDAFMATALQLVKATQANEGEPPEKWGWQLAGITEALANGLLGLPVHED